MIKFNCSDCNKVYIVKDELAGSFANCVCGNEYSVPMTHSDGKKVAPKETRWICVIKGEEYGPHTVEELRGLVKDGLLTKEDTVWKEGTDDWLGASEIKGLFSWQPPQIKSNEMLIKFKCPECDNSFSVEKEMAGRAAKCPCGKDIVVPEPYSGEDESQPEETRWICVIRGEEYGPHTVEELREFVRNGRLTRDDTVWKEGTEDWLGASDIEGLFTV